MTSFIFYYYSEKLVVPFRITIEASICGRGVKRAGRPMERLWAGLWPGTATVVPVAGRSGPAL